MRRRDFINVLGGATAIWPLAALAQRADQPRRIGMIIARSENDPEGQRQAAAFDRGLRELGWVPGRNAQVELRWQTDPRQRTAVVNDLLALKPHILVINSTPYLAAARDATRAIPIVFIAVADPVAQGFVQSLAKPGGLMTGFGAEEPSMGAKWAELLREIAPATQSITAIFNPASSPFSRLFLPSIEAVLRPASTNFTISPVGDEDAIEQAIAAAARQSGSGLIFLPDSFLASRRQLVVEAVARRRLPAIYWVTPFVQSGGLIAYGIDRADIFHRAAAYVDRVLKGEDPANLPIQMPIKFELAINIRAARSLGLTVPPMLLARADEVIE